MGSCAAPSAKGDDKFITTDYLQQCLASMNDIQRIIGSTLPQQDMNDMTRRPLEAFLQQASGGGNNTVATAALGAGNAEDKNLEEPEERPADVPGR
jgi:hypothetical protein